MAKQYMISNIIRIQMIQIFSALKSSKLLLLVLFLATLGWNRSIEMFCLV
jgi:hypothetical protein